MSIITWLLTFLLILDCMVLILLVLIQLPKKEAGMGQAFGGAATDALFGSGSGTALTKMTKYTAGIFFVLTLLISMLHSHAARAKTGDLRAILTPEEKQTLAAQTGAAAKTNKPAPASTNISLISGTNAASKAATNVGAAAPK